MNEVTEHPDKCFTDGVRQLAEIIREQKTANWLAVADVFDDCAENIDRLHATARAALAGIENPAAFVEAARGMAEALEILSARPHLADSDVKKLADASLTPFRAQIREA